MENSIVAIEESDHRRRDSALKLGSLVQINSIAIDISTSVMNVMESPTHEHFSIRGFVAGMRKKNRKTTLPFASQGNDVDLMDDLPPLLVPKFRWWQCSNCIPDMAVRSTKETVMTGISDVGTSSCLNGGEKAGLLVHSGENIGNKLGLRENTDHEEVKDPGNKEKTKVMDNEMNPIQIRERLNDTVDPSDMVCVAEHPSCIVDGPRNVSLGNDGNLNALPQRRRPKLRSLADIMVEEKNSITDNPKTKSASSGGMQIISTEMEPVLVPQLDLEVKADVAEASRSPERKRKFALEEDRGSLGVIYSNAANKLRGVMLDAEKKIKRVETSDTESEGDAFMRLDSQAQQTKPKKHKYSDVSRKMKQTVIENGSNRESSKISVKCSANLQKYGETLPYFRSILPGQQIQRVSNVPNKAVEVEDGFDSLMPPNKSILVDWNIKGKVGLDLSLNSYSGAERNSYSEASFREHRNIPDLNEEFNHAKQFSAISEKRSLPQQKNADISASGSRENAREGKKQFGFAKPPKQDRNMEHGASDDIPMEIVELLARNQHERALGNSKQHIYNSTSGYRSFYVDKHPDMINFPPSNARNGLTVTYKNTGFGQNNSTVNFPPLKNCQLDINKPEESQFRLFSSAKPSQQRKTQFPSSGSTELLWPPMTENVPPFCLSIPKKHGIQQNSMGLHLFSGQRPNGNPICDMKDGRDKRSLDPNSNDTFTAMQLLSLMDRQVVPSGSSFELGTKSFLDKPLSPYAHHTRINGKENNNFHDGAFFPLNNHSKDFSGSRYGVYSSGESSKKNSSYLQGQVVLQPGNSRANNPLKSSSSLATRLARSDLSLGVCTLNRNPADFSVPDARNMFTISAKDLKPRKRNVSKEKSRLVNGELIRKRQRMKKDDTGKNAQESSRVL